MSERGRKVAGPFQGWIFYIIDWEQWALSWWDLVVYLAKEMNEPISTVERWPLSKVWRVTTILNGIFDRQRDAAGKSK